MIALRQYVGLSGKSPFGQWLDGLDDPAAARVLTTLTRIEQGNFASVKGSAAGCSNHGSTSVRAYGCISGKTARQS